MHPPELCPLTVNRGRSTEEPSARPAQGGSAKSAIRRAAIWPRHRAAGGCAGLAAAAYGGIGAAGRRRSSTSTCMLRWRLLPAACCLAPTPCPLTARRRSPPHLRTTAVRRWARALHQGPAAASLLPERPTAAPQARVHRALPKVLQHHAREGHRRCRAPRGVAVIPPHPGGAGQHAQELCARPRGEHSALQAVVSNPRRFAE
jgi:hypothetical protein